jgi:DNA-directed RNA polymerase specialized sigma subunit
MIRTAFGRLKPIDQEILQLTVLDELDCKAAAERLGISHDAARRRRCDAIKRLRSTREVKPMLDEILGERGEP